MNKEEFMSDIKVTNVTGAVIPAPSVDEQIKMIELQEKQLSLELKKAELEAKLLEKQEREYHIKDLKARLADRDIAEKQSREDREQQGRTFAQQDATDQYRYRICTHKKGGIVTPRDMRVLTTGGNNIQYAIMKHQMINGDIWVRCLRCGKTWAPPVEINYFFNDKGKQVAPQDGIFDKAHFERSRDEYIRATMFETNNSMSGSVQCRFSTFDVESGKMVDASDKYRESIASTTLR
jgi:hypothetical protein